MVQCLGLSRGRHSSIRSTSDCEEETVKRRRRESRGRTERRAESPADFTAVYPLVYLLAGLDSVCDLVISRLFPPPLVFQVSRRSPTGPRRSQLEE